ncbi:MAG: valine--tRNA ligase, partial [Candidatus Diapherotrites archaeon]|nr:valine--tRNA ligase [Candidatus Diapherotrites archaeon]
MAEGSFNPKIEEKRWKIEFEEEMIEKWKGEDWWKFRPEEGKPVFVIDTPPPYPAPVWHVAAALGYTFQDMIARSRRMMGYSVLYPIGMDGNGLPIEFYMEKYLGVNMFEYDREEFIRLCREELAKWKKNMRDIMQRFELSGDYEENYYETDSPEYRKLTQLTFKILWDRGLIYEDERPNNWCPKCRTTIADAEVEYQEVEGWLYLVKYRVKETGEELLVATTRPELLAACKAVLIHPDDERYKHLHGKTAIVPLYNREVPIIPHPAVDPEFGTGVMHLCSFGDLDDVRLFRELGLEPVRVIDQEGRLTEAAGPELAGLKVGEARKRIVELLEARGLLAGKKKVKHRVPHHERCNTPIEIIPMKEYYLKQVEFKEDLKKIAKEITFIPERYRQDLLNWIESVSIDWPISRRRYYGTEVPVWTCRNCGHKLVKGGEKYWQPWKEDPGENCPVCGARDWEGDGRVLDTWMDSSITVLYITGWQRKPQLFEVAWKGEKLRPQGYDIIRTWLYYTLLRVYQLLGERAFDYVFINGMGLDKHGRRMSKRLGNVIDPWDLVKRQGADTLRLWLAMEATPGENYRINEEKISGMKKFLTKLWNVARYISAYPIPEERPELLPLDHWILSELNKLIDDVVEAYREFNFQRAARRLYSFTWNLFAGHYIELSKRRAKMDGWDEGAARAAWWTLHRVLRSLLLLFAPITPAITDKIWRELYGERSIHYERFPEKVEGIEDYSSLTEKIMEFNSSVWKAKKERG